MKKVAIVLDDWKLPIFTKALDAHGYQYTQHEGVTAKTLTLKIETDDMIALAKVFKQAKTDAAFHKRRN